ncbi:hypothetical protein F5884DRAFT_865179 [Xylogone sp. PMI_703]|nr:hypothetical protein F5884DRAFT_865179 [Xylogone sp. PMI_703]
MCASQQHASSQGEKLRETLDISNFDLNAILRGAQLTVVGALRALQNPALFTSEHYKQAIVAVAAGIAIRLIIAIPIIGIKVLLWLLSFVIDLGTTTWDDRLVGGLDFVENYVLQVPFFLMSLMRYVTPTLDNIITNASRFMDSLKWVDTTYYAKHRGEDPSSLRLEYYPNLKLYPIRDGSTHSKSAAEAITTFLIRFGKKAGLSLAVFALSYVPYLGRLVLPAASFYTFNKTVGLGPAALIFGTGMFLPRRYLVVFLQSYFASRSLTRELLEPYFSRIRFTKEEKRRFFHDREGLLFGFGIGFYIFLRIPLLGVLIYGIAEASTAYLITKITDPPPPPASSEGFAASQQKWKNKHEFLNLHLSNLDAYNLPTEHPAKPVSPEEKKSASSGDQTKSPHSEVRSR